MVRHRHPRNTRFFSFIAHRARRADEYAMEDFTNENMSHLYFTTIIEQDFTRSEDDPEERWIMYGIGKLQTSIPWGVMRNLASILPIRSVRTYPLVGPIGLMNMQFKVMAFADSVEDRSTEMVNFSAQGGVTILSRRDLQPDTMEDSDDGM